MQKIPKKGFYKIQPLQGLKGVKMKKIIENIFISSLSKLTSRTYPDIINIKEKSTEWLFIFKKQLKKNTQFFLF